MNGFNTKKKIALVVENLYTEFAQESSVKFSNDTGSKKSSAEEASKNDASTIASAISNVFYHSIATCVANMLGHKGNWSFNEIRREIEKEEPETEIYINNKEEKDIKIYQNNISLFHSIISPPVSLPQDISS